LFACDFEYDGRYLSDFGFILCTFDGSSGSQVVDTGSSIQFNKVSMNHGKKFSLTSSQYNDCLQATFQICKDPKENLTDAEMMITKDEYRDIARWLNRGEFCKFQVIYDNNDDVYDTEPCYYNASFNLQRIVVDDRVFGIELQMETDMPFGYGAEVTRTLTASVTNLSMIVYDSSDDVGYTYPDIELTCQSNGDYTITSTPEGTTTTIANCTSGEVIHLYGDTKIITSSLDSHNVAADFDLYFDKTGRDEDMRDPG